MFSKEFSLNPKQTYAAPGEVLVVLQEEANRQITKNIPQGPIRRVAAPLPTSFGIDRLDSALKEFCCASICRVHAPMPIKQTAQDYRQMQMSNELQATYRIRFEEEGMDIEAAIKTLQGLNEVKVACPNHLRFVQATPNDAMYVSQWGLDRIKCPDAWNHSTGNGNVKIAVVDSGVDLNHPDLNGNLIQGRDFVDLMSFGANAGDVITLNGSQWQIQGDVLTVDNNPQDEVGHGTHVAGTVGAVSDNIQGVAGVAWSCKLMPVRVLFRIQRLSDGLVIGVGTDADIAAGITWAVDQGVDIINLSLGGPNSNPVQQAAINHAVMNDVLVVAAMGNDNSSAPSYPAAYPNVFAVGAIDQFDNRAFFSNFGPHIDVVAPGVSINSTYWDDTYTNLDGTSMAAPHVAGLAALILSCNASLTATQVADIIRQTAENLKDNPSDPVPNDRYGYGVINAKAALDRVCRVKVPALDTGITKDIIQTQPGRDIWNTLPGVDTTVINDIVETKPYLDSIKTRPSLDQIETNTILDQVGTSPIKDDIGTRPSIDWVKNPALDKNPASDRLDIFEDPLGPFVLTTPHHYGGSKAKSRMETLESIFAQAKKAQSEGNLSDADLQQLDRLYEEYQQLKQA